MKKAFLKNTVQAALGIGLLVAATALTGCQTPTPDNIKFTSVPEGEEMPSGTAAPDDPMRLAKGDNVIVIFAGQSDLEPHQESIKEDGTITLEHIKDIKAEGKTTGELQREIHDAYVPTYYKRLTVTVKTDRLIYYVQGYVRQSGRQEYLGQTTVLKAIASAGDFNDFADRRDVIVTRKDGTVLHVNCMKAAKNPALDIAVFPGDKIEVKQRPAFSFRPW
jgi:protein involved in polysaccharide export with SLBB domain